MFRQYRPRLRQLGDLGAANGLDVDRLIIWNVIFNSGAFILRDSITGVTNDRWLQLLLLIVFASARVLRKLKAMVTRRSPSPRC